MNEISLGTVYKTMTRPTYRIPFNIADELLLIMTRVNGKDDEAKLELTGGLEGATGFVRGPQRIEEFVEPEVRKKVGHYISQTLFEIDDIARDIMIARAVLAGQEDREKAESYTFQASNLGIYSGVTRSKLNEYYDTIGLKQISWFLLNSFATSSAENIAQFGEYSPISDEVVSLYQFYELLAFTAAETLVPVNKATYLLTEIVKPKLLSTEPKPEKYLS